MAKTYAPLNISTLDGGRALEALQQAVKQIEQDLIDRSDQEGMRKAILAVTITSKIDKETGETSGPLIEWEALTRIPGTKSRVIYGKVQNNRIMTPLFDSLSVEEQGEEAAARG